MNKLEAAIRAAKDASGSDAGRFFVADDFSEGAYQTSLDEHLATILNAAAAEELIPAADWEAKLGEALGIFPVKGGRWENPGGRSYASFLEAATSEIAFLQVWDGANRDKIRSLMKENATLLEALKYALTRGGQ